MTPLEVIEREKSCVLRQGTADCDRDCKNCDLVLPADEVVKAYDYVTKLTEKNNELKERLECAEHNCKVLRERNDNQYNAVMEFRETAKEIISVFLKYDEYESFAPDSSEYEEYEGNKRRAEDFLKDVL